MNLPYSMRRRPTQPPSAWRRFEVTSLDLMITTVETLQPQRLSSQARRAWQVVDNQSAARQAALAAGVAFVFFVLGLLKGAL